RSRVHDVVGELVQVNRVAAVNFVSAIPFRIEPEGKPRAPLSGVDDELPAAVAVAVAVVTDAQVEAPVAAELKAVLEETRVRRQLGPSQSLEKRKPDDLGQPRAENRKQCRPPHDR